MKIKLMKLDKLIELMLVILLILTFNTVYITTNGVIPSLLKLFLLGFIGLYFITRIIYLYSKNCDVLPLKRFLIIYILPTFLLGLFYITRDGSLNFYYLYILLPFIFVLSLFNNKDSSIIKYYVIVVSILASISLFFWVLSMVGFSYNSSIWISWGIPRFIPGYFNIHFIPQGTISFFGINIFRNTGIFTEAPMFSFILVIAFLALNFYDKKNSKEFNFLSNYPKLFVLLSITILTTTSTTGIISIILVIVSKIFIMMRNNIKFIFMVVPIIILSIIFLKNIMLFKIDTMSGSVSLRTEDLESAYKSWLRSPIIGHGPKSVDYLNYMNYSRILNEQTGYSSSLGIIISKFGIAGLLLLVIQPMFFCIKKSISNIFPLSILFFNILLTNIPSTFLFVFIVSLMYINSLNNGDEYE